MAKTPVRLDHVARLVPPWREPRFSECRKPLEKVVWLTHAELLSKFNSQGRWASATTCGVCLDAVTRWHKDWHDAPDSVVERDLYNTRALDSPHRRDLRLELWALAELVRRHPDEFRELCEQFGAPPPARPRVGLRVIKTRK